MCIEPSWQTAPELLTLPLSEVHVWRASLDVDPAALRLWCGRSSYRLFLIAAYLGGLMGLEGKVAASWPQSKIEDETT
jgi:hypothetical protein